MGGSFGRNSSQNLRSPITADIAILVMYIDFPGTHGLSEARDLYRAIPAMTLDLGLNGLIRRITLSRFVTSYDEPREPDYRCTGQKRFLFAPRPLSYSRFSPTVAP